MPAEIETPNARVRAFAGSGRIPGCPAPPAAASAPVAGGDLHGPHERSGTRRKPARHYQLIVRELVPTCDSTKPVRFLVAGPGLARRFVRLVGPAASGTSRAVPMGHGWSG